MVFKPCYEVLKNGLSGIMRVKNEARYIENCIGSCIDALDELIVVYNDCTDDTPAILERMQKLYPEKIKLYPFNHHILAYNLTPEEFEYAKNLPEDSLRLHSTQCNYGLSKVTYKYALKIDPDQLYFTDELRKWRDICHEGRTYRWNVRCVCGCLFSTYISVYRKFSTIVGRPILWMLPTFLVNLFKKSYSYYAKLKLLNGSGCIALSGVNVFWDSQWYVPFDGINVHPPYNGAGDHLIFRVSEKTYYSKLIASPTYIVERFHCPFRMMFAGPMWFHLHANKENCWEKVKEVKDEYPDRFVPIKKFVSMSYRAVHNRMDKKAHSLFQRIWFAIIHKMGARTIERHISQLIALGERSVTKE